MGDCDKDFACCKALLQRSPCCGPVLRKVEEYTGEGKGCFPFLCSWCWVLLGAKCWVVAGVFWAIVAGDPRGTKVTAYNEAVTHWVHGGAFAVWEAANALNTTVPIYLGRSGQETLYNMSNCSSTVGGCGADAWRALSSGLDNLNDAWSNELKTNRVSMIWSATIPGVHVSGRASGASSVTVRLPGDPAPLASSAVYDCEYKRSIVTCDQSPTKKCYRNEYVSANRKWLKTVNLVQNGDNKLALDPCPYTFESKSQGWVTEDNAANDDTAENAAKAVCRNSAPDQDIGVTVAVRSARDPWVIAGELTGCSHNFGLDVEIYYVGAIAFTVCGCIFGLPLVLFGLWVLFNRVGARGSDVKRVTNGVEVGG